MKKLLAWMLNNIMMNQTSSKKTSRRRRSRHVAMQALYQWQFNQLSATELVHEFLTNEDTPKVDQDYFSKLVVGTIEHLAEIDSVVSTKLDRRINELNPVELAILRVATYELKYQMEIPYRVVINEALEVAKCYGSEEGHKYINGVLDTLAKDLRSIEMT